MAPTNSESKTADQFYLRDSRSNTGSSAMFWSITGGYTTNINEAEKFSRDDALSQYKDRETDIPLRCDLIDPLAYKAIDHQKVELDYPEDENGQYVYQLMGSWDGNNIKFASSAKRFSYDYGKAMTGSSNTSEDPNIRPLPKSAMDRLARSVVSASDINTKEFLKAAGIKEIKVKPRKIRSDLVRFNCPECGRINWSSNPYSDGFCWSHSL